MALQRMERVRDGESLYATISTICNARFSPRAAWNAQFLTSVIRSLPLALSLRWKTSIVRLASGETRSLTNAGGQAAMHARLMRLSRKRELG
jgi:hypothetical protein